MNSKPIYFVSIAWGFTAFCLMCSSSAYLHAQESAGKTIMARGEVNAANDDSGERALTRRAPVFTIDSVTTGQLSATQLRMIDGGLLSLQQDSQLAISDYQFNAETEQGSVSMSLLKGGLRTVTGALQSNAENYRLDTPIASIGVRGTHYEAELVDGDLYLAGWQGTIDVSVERSNTEFSLGPDENYRFAIVRADGSVEFLILAPVQFTVGHSNERLLNLPQDEAPQFAVLSAQSQSRMAPTLQQADIEIDTFGETFIDNDQLVSRILPDDQGIVRSGSATFDQLLSNDFTSSAGAISNLNMSITVNFDTASIPTGNISFSDPQGEWFAAFNGLIRENALDVNINFASHNNNLADGIMSGIFIDGASSILGDISLYEINQPNVQAGGAFVLTERTP